jgi:hypothetical protein
METFTSKASSMSTDVKSVAAVDQCITAVKQRPDGTDIYPKAGKEICVFTTDQNIALLKIDRIGNNPYKLEARVTVWTLY